MAQTQNEKALKVIAGQIQKLDNNEILFQEVGMRFHTQKIRLDLWDILTKNGYELTRDYKLIKKS